MAVITAEDIGGDEDLARRVLAVARSIAPIDSITDIETRKDAIAILRAVAHEGAARGSRQVAAQRVGMAFITYSPASGWFTDEDRGALRTLCGISPGASRTPVGHFPQADRTSKQFWPERYDT